MPLLIDEPRWPAHGRLWSHLISDTSFGELHAFADLLGLPARSFEGDHYDVPAERYDAVVAAGARSVSMRELVIALHSSGLRRPKRKGERVLASTLLPDAGADQRARVDLLASSLPAPVPPTRIEVLVFQRSRTVARPSLLLVHDPTDARPWSLPGSDVVASPALEPPAARVVHEQAGIRLDPADLRICGHMRTVTDQSAWTTHLTGTVDGTAEPVAHARWFPTDAAAADIVPAPWWPLVGWLLDRRQPRTS